MKPYNFDKIIRDYYSLGLFEENFKSMPKEELCFDLEQLNSLLIVVEDGGFDDEDNYSISNHDEDDIEKKLSLILKHTPSNVLHSFLNSLDFEKNPFLINSKALTILGNYGFDFDKPNLKKSSFLNILIYHSDLTPYVISFVKKENIKEYLSIVEDIHNNNKLKISNFDYIKKILQTYIIKYKLEGLISEKPLNKQPKI